jgi:hypothetical protein
MDWNTEHEDFTINNDEGEEAITVDLDNEDITVFYSKDFDLAKDIAKKLGIKHIERDYQNEG